MIFLLAALVLLVALAAAPLWSSAMAGAKGRLAFALALGGALGAGHWESLTRNQPWANPDEAQMIAGALTLRHAPVFWRDVDGTTHGPLDQWPLTLASRAGLPLDFAGARMLGLACVFALLLLLATSLAADNEAAGRLAVLPAAVWLATLREPEFHQLSSEHVPLALLGAACAAGLNLTSAQPTSRWRAGFFGALLVALPLAKLQAAPLAAALGLCWLLQMARSPAPARWSRVVPAALGGATVLGLVLGPTFLAGAGEEFWTSYVVANRNYALGGTWDPSWPRHVWGLSWLIAISLALSAVAAVTDGRRLVRHPALLAGVILGGATLFAILLPGYPILHYWLLLVPALVLLSGAAVNVWLARSAVSRPLVLAGAVAVTLPFVLKVSLQDYSRWEAQLANPPVFSPAASAAVQRLSGPGESIAVWGWAPELYVLAQRRQASREAHTFAQIQPGPLQAHFRARFMADLRRNQPAVFVDAVHPGAFSYNDRARHAHEIFPELAAWIRGGYELDGDHDGLRVYRRREP